ncbi:hypothetical protein [Mycolicibacterium komossense]|nr:hypothetical protein [Mycolicibacterium komossense]
MLAEKETLTGACDTPGYVPGYGPIPAEAVRGIGPRPRWPSSSASGT